MPIKKSLVAAVIAASALGVGGAANAAELTTAPSSPPPPTRTINDLAVPETVEESSTCEGNISCAILEKLCLTVGGTYNGWESKTPGHGHTHGVCTWPWE